MSKLINFWDRLLPEWRFAITGFAALRLTLIIWSMIVYAAIPIALQNLDLFGEPLLTIFALRTSERYVYSRQVDDKVLSFRLYDLNHLIDDQTRSIWSIQDGKALQGSYAGKSLAHSSHSVDEIFPYLGTPPAKNIALALWQRFDTNWYLKIAAHGYDGSDGSTVYFPFYPMMIRILAFVFPPLFSAILISNLALIGVIVLMYRLVLRMTDVPTTRRALIYFLIFPTSFFLTIAYTESLFLLFTLGSLYEASRRRWVWAALWAAFAALTRLQGVLLIIPLAYMLWHETGALSLRKLIIHSLPLGIIPLASLSFLAYSNLSLLNTYKGTLHAKFVLPWNNIFATISLLAHKQGSIVDTLNLIVTIGLIMMMIAVWKNLSFEYTLCSLLMLVAPMFRMTTAQPLVSMTRYALVVFPAFIILGIWGRNRWINRAIIYTSVLLQLYLSAQFILWGWVA